MIPRRFIRIWLGPSAIPEPFETWWTDFQVLHPTFEHRTIRDADAHAFITVQIRSLYDVADSYASRSDILRYAVLHAIGGIYVDIDVMPLRSFEPLITSPLPFAAKRSGKSFETAVLGSPARHAATAALLDQLPAWYASHPGAAASVRTGPAFLSSVWFGREDVRHLPTQAFYPYNGFCAPKRAAKEQLFRDRDFPAEMYAAHFSNHRWGGRPK